LQLATDLHSQGIIFRDWHPKNIGVSNCGKNIFLINFRAAALLNAPVTKGISFGDNTFWSVNATKMSGNCNFFLKSGVCKRDDIESIANLLVYFAQGGNLPWLNQDKNRILEGDKQFDFTKGLPEVFNKFWEKVIQIKGKGAPNYKELVEILSNELKTVQDGNQTITFDWELPVPDPPLESKMEIDPPKETQKKEVKKTGSISSSQEAPAPSSQTVTSSQESSSSSIKEPAPSKESSRNNSSEKAANAKSKKEEPATVERKEEKSISTTLPKANVVVQDLPANVSSPKKAPNSEKKSSNAQPIVVSDSSDDDESSSSEEEEKKPAKKGRKKAAPKPKVTKKKKVESEEDEDSKESDKEEVQKPESPEEDKKKKRKTTTTTPARVYSTRSRSKTTK
jgi:hypothetical protein